MYYSDYQKQQGQVDFQNIIENLDTQSKLLAIEESKGGYLRLNIRFGNITQIQVPPLAVEALIMVESDPTATDPTRAMRFKENGVSPTPSSGFGLGNNDVYQIKGNEHLKNFRITGIEEGKSHFVQVQFFKKVIVNSSVGNGIPDITPFS